MNQELAEKEATLQHVVRPGLPPSVEDASEVVTEDCITAYRTLPCYKSTVELAEIYRSHAGVDSPLENPRGSAAPLDAPSTARPEVTP